MPSSTTSGNVATRLAEQLSEALKTDVWSCVCTTEVVEVTKPELDEEEEVEAAVTPLVDVAVAGAAVEATLEDDVELIAAVEPPLDEVEVDALDAELEVAADDVVVPLAAVEAEVTVEVEVMGPVAVAAGVDVVAPLDVAVLDVVDADVIGADVDEVDVALEAVVEVVLLPLAGAVVDVELPVVDVELAVV